MKFVRICLTALLGCACGSKVDTSLLGPASGTDSRAIGVCDAGRALLLHEMKLTCSFFPASPISKPLPFWPSKLPCKKTVEMEDGTLFDTVTYDYSKPRMPFATLGEATFNDDGNVLTWKPTEVFPGDPPTVFYNYDGSQLIGARVEFPDGKVSTYEYRYDGDRRVAEGKIENGTFTPYYMYVYDDQDRLDREGCAGPGGSEPAAPPAEVIAACEMPSDCGPNCPAAFRCAEGPSGPYTAPLLSADDGPACSVAQVTHRYGASGRVETTIIAGAPGLQFGRLRYEYEGDNLKTVTGGRPETTEPTLGLQRMTYFFECAE